MNDLFSAVKSSEAERFCILCRSLRQTAFHVHFYLPLRDEPTLCCHTGHYFSQDFIAVRAVLPTPNPTHTHTQDYNLSTTILITTYETFTSQQHFTPLRVE